MVDISQLNTEIVRQGDIMLKRIDKIEGAKQIHRGGMIEEGEQTGHVHRLPDNVSKFYETSNGKMLIELEKPAQITHEDHLPVHTPEGSFEVIKEREFDYGTYVDRIVRD